MSATTTTTTSTTVTVKKARKASLPHPQAQRMQAIAAHWMALSGLVKSGWDALTGMVYNPTQPGLPTRQGGYNTYFSVASALLDAGSTTFPTVAPAAYTPPQELPSCTLTAKVSASTGAPTVMLNAASAVTGAKVVVFGARPRPASRGIRKSTTFVRIGVITLSTINDLSALYSGTFRIPGPGYAVGVKLVAVSPDGFKSAPLMVTTTSVAILGSDEGPKRRRKAA